MNNYKANPECVVLWKDIDTILLWLDLGKFTHDTGIFSFYYFTFTEECLSQKIENARRTKKRNNIGNFINRCFVRCPGSSSRSPFLLSKRPFPIGVCFCS